MNYTKIRIVFNDSTELYISEEELTVFKLSGEYGYIAYKNVHGHSHRTDGPAHEWADGTKEWGVDGKRHRLDGPAIECADGHKQWFVNGQEYSKEEFEKEFG